MKSTFWGLTLVVFRNVPNGRYFSGERLWVWQYMNITSKNSENALRSFGSIPNNMGVSKCVRAHTPCA